MAMAVMGMAALAVFASGAAARQATPAAYPATPLPAECVIEPVPVTHVMGLLATPVAASRQAEPTPFVLPDGVPADEETAAAVTATLHQLFACVNAGDPLRFATLFSDDFIRDFYVGVPLGQVLGFLSSEPQPLSDEQRRIIVRFGEVRILEDGRAGVTIVLDEPDDPRTEEPDYVILVEDDGRWLVDEVHEG
jgi:hypothetical protein